MLLLLVVSMVAYLMVYLSPIDPVRAYIGDEILKLSAEQKKRIEDKWGLKDQPMVQYIKWIGNIIRGDWGRSLIYNRPVMDIMIEKFYLSFGLMGCAWLFSGLMGYGLGLVSGSKTGSIVDRIIRFVAYAIASCPSFWTGMLLLMCFSVWLNLTPICCASPIGVDPSRISLAQWLHHVMLPAATLSTVGVTNVLLHTRQKLKDVMESDFVLFAKAQGARRMNIIFKHGVRNTSHTAVQVHFTSFSELFGGAVLAEVVFAYPGLGQALVQAGLRSDVPLLLGVVFFSAVFVYIGNTAADVINRVVDPRIRLNGAA